MVNRKDGGGPPGGVTIWCGRPSVVTSGAPSPVPHCLFKDSLVRHALRDVRRFGLHMRYLRVGLCTWLGDNCGCK